MWCVLERYQALVYLVAFGGGLVVGVFLSDRFWVLGITLRVVLAFLLYTIFAQIPLTHVRQGMGDVSFMAVAIVGNFLVVPVLVWGLVQLLPNDPAVRLGTLMVLLVPCTDWFITFTHLGGGDTGLAIAFTPLSLLLQIALFPHYLWLFIGESLFIAVAWEMLTAFLSFILLPLLGAFLTQKWAGASRHNLLERLALLPIPLLAVVVFIIAATHADLVTSSSQALLQLLWIYTAYLAITPIIAWILASAFKLPPHQGRVLAFGLETRNSFVVLSLALSLRPSNLQPSRLSFNLWSSLWA